MTDVRSAGSGIPEAQVPRVRDVVAIDVVIGWVLLVGGVTRLVGFDRDEIPLIVIALDVEDFVEPVRGDLAAGIVRARGGPVGEHDPAGLGQRDDLTVLVDAIAGHLLPEFRFGIAFHYG